MLYLAVSLFISVCVICGSSMWIYKATWKRQDAMRKEITETTENMLNALGEAFVEYQQTRTKVEELKKEVEEE